jgi:hypothetical protein
MLGHFLNLHLKNENNKDSVQYGRRTKYFLSKPLRIESLESRQMLTTFTWSGLGSDSNWNTGSNWYGGVAPYGTTIDLVFQGDRNKLTNNNLPTNPTINSIEFDASNFKIAGSPVNISSKISVQTSSIPITGIDIQASVNLGT